MMNNLQAIVPAIVLQIILFVTGFLLQKNNPGLVTLNSIGYSVFISRGPGLVLAVLQALTLFPVCRHTITFFSSKFIMFRRYYPENSIALHKFFAYCVLFWALVHGVNHYINFEVVFEKRILTENLHY